jgi:hypothetical protein
VRDRRAEGFVLGRSVAAASFDGIRTAGSGPVRNPAALGRDGGEVVAGAAGLGSQAGADGVARVVHGDARAPAPCRTTSSKNHANVIRASTPGEDLSTSFSGGVVGDGDRDIVASISRSVRLIVGAVMP